MKISKCNPGYLLLFVMLFIYIGLFLLLPNIMQIKALNFYSNNYYELYKHLYIFPLTVLLLIIIFILYVLFIYFEKCLFFNLKFKTLLMFAIGINLVSFVVFPIFSSDIFYYLYSARIFVIHNLNPFVDKYANLSMDAFYSVLGGHMWSMYNSSYGSLFILISSIPAIVFSKSLFGTIMMFKFIAVILNIINGYLVYKITNNKLAYFLYAFNPFLILELSVNNHNEVFQIFFILLAFYYLFRNASVKYHLLSILFLVFSVLIKVTSIIFLPFFIIFVLQGIKLIRDKIKFLLLIFASIIVIVIISYLPFHTKWREVITPIINQSHLLSYIFLSPAIMVFVRVLNIFDVNNSLTISVLIGKILFLLSYIYILISSLMRRNDDGAQSALRYCILAGGIFLITFFTWLMPWYFTTFITLSILYCSVLNRKKYLIFIYGFTVYGILYYLILR